MLSKEIPFRPKLDGEFRIRFYSAVSVINSQSTIADIEKIVKKEIDWVENICNYNLDQRKKYRAIWMLFRDLIRSSWEADFREGILYMHMRLPLLDKKYKTHKHSKVDDNINETKQTKDLLRSWTEESRFECLVANTDFIKRMEKHNSVGHSIDELIADGEELAERLQKVRNGDLDLKEAVIPYLQLISNNERDEYTGIKLSEIWRYFRLTWSTPAETTPGRTMQYLIRDAAHPKHAVMGIASIENTTVQISCRDDYIGWNQTSYIEKLDGYKKEGNVYQIIGSFNQLLQYIETGIAGIDYRDLCSDYDVEQPTEDVIQKLLDIASLAEQKRQDLLKVTQEQGIEDEAKSELGRITKETEDALYKRKRAEQLAKLLYAKIKISEQVDPQIVSSDNYIQLCERFWKSDIGNSVIRTALIAQKTQHIGSSIMELTVCGAIPPYNEILGGKLVALLATSPQVIHDYKMRYGNSSSMIASRLKGEKVVRPADLVYLGTTSLYYIGSSQYNRLKIPARVFNSGYDINWKKLGTTIGFGTMHISKATTLCLSETVNKDFNRFNHVFGEGANPKLRLLATALRELLESSSDDTKDFSKHAMSRIVYGVSLASNTIDYLLGMDNAPKYYTDINNYQEGTQKIIDFWSDRWLKSRLNHEPIYQRIAGFNKETFLVGSQLKEKDCWKFHSLEEKAQMQSQEGNNKTGLQFIRGFYRGTSAYADFMDEERLSNIHLKTKLDDAILDDIKTGKDVVLTGNPGDGKTHIIRILLAQLGGLRDNVIIEIDASTLSIEEIHTHWANAREQHKPYVIAINAAVLDGFSKTYPEFPPAKAAYHQMVNSVVFHNEQEEDDSVIVYDLSKRDVLTIDILKSAISKLTDESHYQECTRCNVKESCPVNNNRRLLQLDIFQSRLSIILRRVSLMGYHATLREIQSFISYLIFGDRSCDKLNKTNGESKYDIVNLIYSGNGELFKRIQKGIDPANISHPILDEEILTNSIDNSSWAEGYHVSAEAISEDNIDLFSLRKRQFFFFNNGGDCLLSVLDDNVAQYEKFLSMDDNKIIREVIDNLNTFFGYDKKLNKNIGLCIWSGHRYNNEARKVLVSTGTMKKSDFSIGRPKLISSMNRGLDMMYNYVRFEKKDNPGIFLKVDFEVYLLFKESQHGVPVLFMESDLVQRVWRFMEQLSSYNNRNDSYVDLSIMDVQSKHVISVSIDMDEDKYMNIEQIDTRKK